MTQCHRTRVAIVRNLLASMPTEQGQYCGENESKMTDEFAARIASRARRADRHGRNAMALPQLVAYSRKLARGRITKPGKRLK